MSNQQPQILNELIEQLAKLPGLGRKTATRIALFFLRQPEAEVELLADTLKEVKKQIRFCSLCHNFTDVDPCERCSDPARDQSIICVVETPADLMALESSGIFKGLYHVLGGGLSPLSGIGPDDLKIQELLDRIDNSNGEIKEILLATGSSPEGESTSSYLVDKLKKYSVSVTRLARGVPIGVDLEFVDGATLKQALENRRQA